MLFKSQIVTAASGSIGGLTASRNKGGMYLKARAMPSDPGTTFQTTMRNFMSQLSTAWVETLDAAQRNAWEVYAFNVSVTNKLGDSSHISGINMYFRSNAARLQAGMTRVDDAPEIFDLGTFTPPVITATAPTGLSVAFTTSDGWASEAGGAMLIGCSRPQNPGKAFFKGPYRRVAPILGTDPGPTTSPQVKVSPFVLAAGQRQFYYIVVVRADGRASPFVRITDIVA